MKTHVKKCILVLGLLLGAVPLARAAETKFTPIAATASHSYNGNPPSNVFDGNSSTSWNAGARPSQWIQLDLGRLVTVSRIRMQVAQTPNGPATHEIRVGATPGSLTLATTTSSTTSDGQWIELSFSAPRLGDVRYMRVTTTSSPSWVAWREIEVWGTPGDWLVNYVDTFDGANNANDSGLNDNLVNRQLNGLDWVNTTWTRRAGTWFDRTPNIWNSQVNHVWHPNVLSFFNDYAAVELGKRFWPGSSNTYRISLTVDPGVNETTSGNWVSVMLDRASGRRGWVAECDFGFLITSGGAMQVFNSGVSKTISGSIPAASTYALDLVITAASPGTLSGTVNGIPVSASFDGILPDASSGAQLYIGTWTSSGQVSHADNLTVMTLNPGARHVDLYGYYWAEGSSYGPHLAEVSSYTNFDMVESAGNLSNPACAPKKCLVQVRWEFFADATGNLNSNWLILWANTLVTLKSYQDRIAALFILDEPYCAVGQNNPNFTTNYQAVLAQVKNDLPGITVFAAFAQPSLSSLPVVNLDWIGFDDYPSSANFSSVIPPELHTLKSRMPGKPTILIPQTHFGGLSGTASDIETAQINWRYYGLAVTDSSVKGLLNFGLWSAVQSADVPMTLSVQKILGKLLIQ